ncbi:MAG TPA: thioesterase family protein [Edaphocola sp.]|nr:thioesterase family protein [Edaphocola sp.]
MQRVNIIFPKRNPVFSTILKIRVSDINYGNHLANDAIVAFLHEARVQFLSSWDYTEFDIEGVALIQADLMVRYKNEAFLGENIKCDIFMGEIQNRSFEMLYRLSTERQQKIVVIAEAKVGLACFDYNTKSLKTIPEKFVEKIKICMNDISQ